MGNWTDGVFCVQAKVIDKTGASVGGGGVFPGLDSDDPLPAVNLTTASDNFYPTVALNALLRVLRDPSMVSKPFLFRISYFFLLSYGRFGLRRVCF
tara:strand:- start:1791 stop:2078 length:288 start_codon:yes stop_codon:yes gene_type:complete